MQRLSEKGDGETRLEWARDSDFRFFPAVKDDLLRIASPYSTLRLTRRLRPRDGVSPGMCWTFSRFSDERHIPLGAVIWASVAKDPGYSPESLIAEIRRNARYRADDFADLALTEPVDAGAVARRFRVVLDEADAFVRAMPAGKEGLVFLRDGAPTQPDPENLSAYEAFGGSRRGHWPSSPEIGSAIVERNSRKP